MPTDPYWSVDLPGLSEDGARAVVEFARQRPEVFGPSACDPRQFLILGLDHTTVRSVADAVRHSPRRDEIAESLLEVLDEWLDYADPGGGASTK